MAKFCIHCGRPLVEGEVCNCQSNVKPQDAVQQPNETLQFKIKEQLMAAVLIKTCHPTNLETKSSLFFPKS